MTMPDAFSAHYQEQLDGHYDCVDRIVLNAYNYYVQSGGGFRCWWRQLFGGDEKLDNTHLMRFAGRFARRIRAFAEARGIPLIECRRGERKHEAAEPHLPADPDFQGLFCILVGRAPAPIREVLRCSNGQPHIRIKTPWSYVNWYHFHIIDREWGHLIIRFCPHPPFNAQVILNGHEYVARRASAAGIPFTKDGNCFTNIAHAADLGRIADAMTAEGGEGRLVRVCERWLYSACLCFALDLREQEQTDFHYGYSVYQQEYSRNLLFARGRVLDRVFAGVIERTRAPLDIKTVRTIFGRRQRPSRRCPSPRCELVVERPVYDLTVFKIHFKRLTVKIYSKGERVLRIEVVAHNTRDLHSPRGIANFSRITAELKGILERFLSVLNAVDVSFIDGGTLESWPEPAQVNGRRVPGLNANQPRVRAAMQAAITLSTQLHGFSAAEHAAHVRQIHAGVAKRYQSRQASYDLKKLRAKGLVRKIANSRRYECTTQGLREMTGYLTLRDKVLLPLLRNAGKRSTGPKGRNYSAIDAHYDRLQLDMQQLFKSLRIAA
jgi:hypothetical protein